MDALGIGVAVRDVSVRLDSFPEPDRKYQALDLSEAGGGPVPTALVTLARWGRQVAFAGVVGDDPPGRFIRDSLRRERVDVDRLVVRPGFRSPTSVIIVENGRRTILEHGQYDLPLRSAELAGIDFDSCPFLLVDARLVDVQREIARQVRRGGGRVVLDCGHPRPGVDALLDVTDVAILSHTYPSTLHGDRYDRREFLARLSARLPADGPRIAGLTLGQDGCALFTPHEGYVRIPGHPVDALDSTGAGDVFHGAFVHASLAGDSAIEAATFANAAAALKCTGRTGRSLRASEEEVRRFARGG